MFQTKENGVRRESRTTGQIKTWSLVGEKRLKLGMAKYGTRSTLSDGWLLATCDYQALRIRLGWIEKCCRCKIYTGFQRLGQKLECDVCH